MMGQEELGIPRDRRCAQLAGGHDSPQQAERLIHLAYQANPGDYRGATALTDNMLASVVQAQQHELTPPQALSQI